MRGRLIAIAAFLFITPALLSAENDVPPNLLQLIDGPDLNEIPCKIQLSKPVLMFQQQYAVAVHGRFPRKVVERGELHRLQFLVKVQDERGDWLAGEDYDHFEVPQHLKKAEVEYGALIYLRPGKYRVGVATFDLDSRKAKVFHEDVNIAALNNDPFPVLDELLPRAEFPVQVGDKRRFWSLGSHMQPIPLHTAQPTRVDIVLNVTKRFRWDIFYRMDVENMLESGSVLGHFHPENGCVRLSVIDALRMTIVLDRFPVNRLSWTKLQDAIANINQDIVDVHVLANQKQIAQFTHDYLDRLAADTAGCDASANLAPLVVVVSPDVVLPDGNRIGALTPLQRNSFVYVHVGEGTAWMDGIGQILSPAKPEKMNCNTPREFRSALAKIAGLISTGMRKPPAAIQH